MCSRGAQKIGNAMIARSSRTHVAVPLEGPGGRERVQIPIPPFLIKGDEALRSELGKLLGDVPEVVQLLDDAGAPRGREPIWGEGKGREGRWPPESGAGGCEVTAAWEAGIQARWRDEERSALRWVGMRIVGCGGRLSARPHLFAFRIGWCKYRTPSKMKNGTTWAKQTRIQCG